MLKRDEGDEIQDYNQVWKDGKKATVIRQKEGGVVAARFAGNGTPHQRREKEIGKILIFIIYSNVFMLAIETKKKKKKHQFKISKKIPHISFKNKQTNANFSKL